MATVTTERDYSKRKNVVALAACGVFAITATMAIVLAIVLTRDDNNRGPKGQWIETFDGTYSSADDIQNKGGMPVGQLYLTRNNGSRLFVSRQPSPFDTSLLQIFDFNETSKRWILHSELQVGRDIPGPQINFMAPSLDGTRVAISDSENVTVYREVHDADDDDIENYNTITFWVPVGETLSTTALTGHVDTTLIYSFGWKSVLSLSRDGTFLTIASLVHYEMYEGKGTLDDDESPYLISSFQEVNNSWRLVAVNVVASLAERGARPVISGSGKRVASPRYVQEDGEWKEAVEIYQSSNSPDDAAPNNNNWTLVSKLIEPPPAADDQPPMTMFGSDARSITFSYTGRTCAIGAINFKASNDAHDRDFHYGRVEVYEQEVGGDTDGEYIRKGQALVPTPDAWQYGKLVSLSQDGNRLAISFAINELFIQVLEYNHKDAKWYSFDSLISESNRYRRQAVKYLSLAADGSRLAIAWECELNELYCVSVYDLVDDA